MIRTNNGERDALVFEGDELVHVEGTALAITELEAGAVVMGLNVSIHKEGAAFILVGDGIPYNVGAKSAKEVVEAVVKYRNAERAASALL